MKDAAVVVATRDRSRLLGQLLIALRAQDFDGSWEVVVVDDGSRDSTGSLLAEAQEDWPELTVVTMAAPGGPAKARNAGWRQSSGAVVVFTDDDCEPAPDWLSEIVKAVRTGSDVVQGRTVPAASGVTGAFSHTLRIDEETGRFETCNMAYDRSLLERLGGFDEGFRYPYGEDIDLGLRALSASVSFSFAPSAVVRHAVHPSSFRARLRVTARQEGIVLVTARHPSFRNTLPGRLWAKPTHPHALMSALGALLIARGRIRSGLLLQLPWLWYRTSVEQLPARKWQWPVVLPLAVALDLAEVAVLLKASAKHRTLVL